MASTPTRSIVSYERPWPVADWVARLKQGAVQFPPATIGPLEPAPAALADGSALGVSVGWGPEAARYAAVYQPSSTPRALAEAALRARAAMNATGMHGLVMAPFLGDAVLSELEAAGLSGIDLCGNGVVVASGFRLWRTGNPNRFRDTRPLRNPFAGDSSIFARCFLLRPEFGSLSDLQAFARSRAPGATGGSEAALGLSTASKVVSALEAELVIARCGRALRLVDADRLADLLRERAPVAAPRRIVGIVRLGRQAVWERLAAAVGYRGFRCVATGLASAAAYGALHGVDRVCLYATDPDRAAQLLEVTEGPAFADIEIIEAGKHLQYFDARTAGPVAWASPIQTWLELALAGPREQDAARRLLRRTMAGPVEPVR